MVARDPYARIKALLETDGECTAMFFKKDGMPRKMVFTVTPPKDWVFKHDIAMALRKANNPHLLNVWDTEISEFRTLNLNTLYELHVEGKTYRVEELTPIVQED